MKFQKLIDHERISGDRMVWMQAHLGLVRILLVTSIVSTLFFAFFLSIQSLILLSILGSLAFFYAFKIKMGRDKKKNLRDISGLKIVLIGLVWSATSVLLNDLEYGNIDGHSLLSFLGMMCFIVGITIPFDIRDLIVDEPSKKTIPQLIGYRPSVFIAVLLILVSSYLIHLGTAFNFWSE